MSAASAPALVALAPAPIDVEALIAAPDKREPSFRIAATAPRTPFGDYTLTRGVSTRGAVKGTAHLVLVNGTQQTGFPVAAAARAILDGILTRPEVEALLAAADAAARKSK